MAEAADYYTKLHHQNQANASKFYYHFFYKALLVTLFVVIIPLFPSQAPEFFNQNLNNRGWEFLQLIFVGIAVSYGLFSRRNDETEKENNNNSNSKFDNAQLYVSRFLQVSSVFDDEVVDSPPRVDDGKKIQTWSNQYYRNDPVVVVEEAEQHSVLETEQLGGTASRTGDKPLLLPVRSLKSRVVDENVVETAKESVSRSSSGSSSGSKRFSSSLSKGRRGLDQQELEEKLKDSVVLPSPIPWRSRSGRMEMKEEAQLVSPFVEESDHSRSFNTQMSRSGRPSSASSSPSLSPSPSMYSPDKSSRSGSSSPEVQSKIAEDFVRKKSIYKSPPPPPPPPPPPMIRKPSSTKTSSRADGGGSYAQEGLKRSFTSDPKISSLAMAKSVRTFRSNSLISEATKDGDFDDQFGSKSNNRSVGAEASAMEWTGRKMDGFDRNLENVRFPPQQTTFMEFSEEEEKEEFGEEQLEMESDEETDVEEDEDDVEEDEDDVEEDEDDVEEDEDDVGSLGNSFVSASSNNQEAVSSSVGDAGPDVDRKADEFIAKFREQIRLQRIESIKISSAQISRKSPR